MHTQYGVHTGAWIAYCDQTTDYGGWTLISSLPKSNTIAPEGCCAVGQCTANKGDPWYFDSEFQSSEANIGNPLPNKKGLAYLRYVLNSAMLHMWLDT